MWQLAGGMLRSARQHWHTLCASAQHQLRNSNNASPMLHHPACTLTILHSSPAPHRPLCKPLQSIPNSPNCPCCSGTTRASCAHGRMRHTACSNPCTCTSACAPNQARNPSQTKPRSRTCPSAWLPPSSVAAAAVPQTAQLPLLQRHQRVYIVHINACNKQPASAQQHQPASQANPRSQTNHAHQPAPQAMC
jgi:hypothetical protein